MAPIMTHARLGSQLPVKSRKAVTLAGCVMPLIPSPIAKSTPETKAVKREFIASLPADD
jgi:hypothetical protein